MYLAVILVLTVKRVNIYSIFGYCSPGMGNKGIVINRVVGTCTHRIHLVARPPANHAVLHGLEPRASELTIFRSKNRQPTCLAFKIRSDQNGI